MSKKLKIRLTEEMPRYPVRHETALAAMVERFRGSDWTRLEGAPETEAALRVFHGGGHVWYLSSGTAALEALLLGHGIGPGDEVVTTPYTWGATVSAILAVGAVPVFADIFRDTGLLDPATVEACITSRTRAILGVHLFGHPCDNQALAALARRHGIRYFEDGSQAHGARLHGERVGRGGDGAAFSCMGLKPLAGSEGGYAVFEDEAALERASLYGKHPRGLSEEAARRLGEAGLLDTLQLGWRPCAFGADLVRVQLPYMEDENAARRANANHLRSLLEGLPGVSLPPEAAGAEGVYHLLSLIYEPEVTGIDRETFNARLREAGLGPFVYIRVPIHRMKRLNPGGYDGPRVLWHAQLERAGVDYREVSCPAAEWRAEHSVEMVFNWTEENPKAMKQIAGAIRQAVD